MVLSFVRSFQSEWLKKKRSLASWIVIAGSFFTPVLIIIARLVNHDKLVSVYSSANFWNQLWHSSWESMALFLLPIGVVLNTSLLTQLEYKNNTWKQLHALPLSLTTVFFSKLAVILVMLIQFFVLFNMGIYLAALVPYLLVGGVPYPNAPVPYFNFMRENLFFLIDCLPIVALQYLLSLQFKNFLVPVGIGFLLWVGALGALSWRYGYLVPYTYGMFNYLKGGVVTRAVIPTVNIHGLAVGYFVAITLVSYLLYLTKKEKG